MQLQSAFHLAHVDLGSRHQRQFQSRHFSTGGGPVTGNAVGPHSRGRHVVHFRVLMRNRDSCQINQHQVIGWTILGMSKSPVRQDGDHRSAVLVLYQNASQLRNGSCRHRACAGQQNDS